MANNSLSCLSKYTFYDILLWVIISEYFFLFTLLSMDFCSVNCLFTYFRSPDTPSSCLKKIMPFSLEHFNIGPSSSLVVSIVLMTSQSSLSLKLLRRSSNVFITFYDIFTSFIGVLLWCIFTLLRHLMTFSRRQWYFWSFIDAFATLNDVLWYFCVVYWRFCGVV